MEPIVFRGANNQALTNSLLVAKEFGKEHKSILRAIKNLIEGSAQNCAAVFDIISRMIAVTKR